MDTLDVVLRLSAATLAGAALGLNRDLKGKPTGVRTLGLVGLGSALAVMAATSADAGAVSRVIQGLVTGIGFLGAGVILHTSEGRQVHGLTTAACTWLTACMGAVCGVGELRMALVSAAIIILVLIFGGPVERAVRRRWRHPDDDLSG
jgi:putative Mg2+ transporter-C (MgtC) family protein